MGWGKVPTGYCDRTLTRPALKSTRRLTIATIFLVLICGLLVSCGGESHLVAPADLSPVTSTALPATPVLASSASASAAPRIGEIVWTAATDPATSAPIEPVASYSPDAPRIIAAAPVRALPAGSRIEATWEYNNTSLDPFTSQLVPTGTVGETWITLHIDRDPEVPWPEGMYQVTISLDGATMQQAAVEVTGQA